MPSIASIDSEQGRSWAESYAVTTREEAEEVMRKQGGISAVTVGSNLKVL